MSMRRVSSRPRLVSDADRASKIATLDLENYYSSDNDDGHGHQNSYFLFEHDDDNANNNGRDDDFSGEEMKKKSSAAVLVADGDNDDEEGCHRHHKMNNTSAATTTKILSPSISDDTLSDYASCCPLYDDDATNNHPSLITNLEMSFKKTSLSSNEDDEEDGGGMLEAAVAAYTNRQLLTTTTTTTTNTSASVKRKRLSSQQHYLTPNSSYAELHQISWYGQSASSMSPPPLPPPASYNGVVQTYSRKQPYHYASKTTTSASRTNTTSPLVLLTHLPEETLVLISTHLTHTDIRSFGSTCHSIRIVLMSSTCAIENLWMERLRSRFPIVFCNSSNRGIRGGGGGNEEEEGRRMMHSSNVTFVDDFGLPMAAASASGGVIGGVDDTNMSNVGSSSSRVNLPLLTGLLAPRYPQVIDLHASLGDGVFRSFDMTIPTTTTADASSDVGVNPPVMGEVVVSVIQFTGRVGTGDRSIRSDKAFPPNCRVIANSSSSNNSSSSSSHGGASLKSLSTWMKNHTPLRSRGNKRKNGRSSSHSLLRDLSPPPPSPLLRHNRHNFPTLSSSPATRHPSYVRRSLLTHTTATTAPPPPSQRSPLFRFLSSLSHHCDSVSSSNISSFDDHETAMDDIGTTFSMENHGSHFDEDDDDDDIGVNDYGMMIRHNGNGLLEQCKQKFGKMYDGHCNKSMKDNLRPFVVPTVVSSSSSSSGVVLVGEEDVSVDVTPRLVAYFEVTILDENVQRGDGETLNRRNNERHLPQQQQQQQPPQQAVLNNGLRRRGDPPPRLLRRDIRRHNNNHQLWGMMPHRVVFPPILLPLPFDPEMFAPLDAQERFVAQAHRAAPPPPPNNNFGQPPPPHFLHNDHGINNDNVFQQRQRHDCVAIGLSTLSFNPRSKMPGWDEHSFGYHGDDGGIFHGHGDMLRRYGPSFGPGDTVGCGLEYSTRKIFFVKNGIFLGWAFEKIDKEMVERGLYPTVGVDTECPIHVNFGQVPFKFDWKGFSREKLFV